VINQKIIRYKNGIAIAKELSKRRHADHTYYDDLISKYQSFLKFYKDLKIWKELSKRSAN